MFGRRSHPHSVPARDQDEEARETAAMLVGLAQLQLNAILDNSDSHDTKALGLLAATAAAVGLLVGARPTVDRYWWASAVGLLAASVCFMGTLWNRGFRVGPDIEAFYDAYWDRPALEASVQMLGELRAAFEANKRVLVTKGRLLTAGYLLIVLTAASSAVYLWLVQ